MSEYRNQGDRNRLRGENQRYERYGRLNERDARRRAYQGERDAFGEWDREAYGQTESGYGRERGPYDRYSSSYPREDRSSFGGAYDDRFERRDDYRDLGSTYGNDRYNADRYGRNDYSAGRSAYDSYGSRERNRPTSDYDRSYASDAYRGEERGFLERAGDEVASWFGDRDAERRREADKQFGGRGPKGYMRSDERIQDDVNDRLTDDHYIDASDIEVSVKDREVTLSGHVPTRDQKRRAEDIVERVSGVTHVQNNLRVETGTGTTSTYGSTTATGTTATGTVASPSEIGGPRGWSTDTTVKTVS